MTIHPRDFRTAALHAATPDIGADGLFERSAAQPATLFSAGSEIYAQGEKAGDLYAIEFGAVRVYRLLADGRRQISSFHLAGEVFGFEAGGTHHFFAEAIGATGIRVIRAGQGADRSHELLPLVLQGLVKAQEHLLVLGRQHAAERVAAFLLDMAARQGDLEEFDLPMSRGDVADYLGLTIETVSRVFSRMKDKGIVRLPSLRRVRILKWDTLRAMSE
jgi:CRP/FNR family transcriptional regulator, nitrogen fixation regulation protein